MSENNRLDNKNVLITGAAGGIGQAIARRLALAGANLVISDRRYEQLLTLKQELDHNGAVCHIIVTDLSDGMQSEKLVNQCIEKVNRLDVVINNAAIMRRGNILNCTDDDFNDSITVNVQAPFRICRAAIKHMQDHQSGVIVNMASCWGVYPGPDHLIYCTTKAAIATMTRCLARDHAKDGIRVNAVCPNEVNTEMLRTGFKIRGLDEDQAILKLNQSVPMGRIAEPEEIADVVAFLCSEQSSYVTGSLLEVNGGKAVY